MKLSLKIIHIIGGIFALIGLGFTLVFIGMQFELFNVKGSSIERNKFFLETAKATTTIPALPKTPCVDKTKTICEWNETPEWAIISHGLSRDSAIINRVSKETGVPARMITSVVVPEQARFFTANREVFKRYFEPLKILTTMTQFSLGVSGIKEKTALDIEKYAKDPTSEFYPGSDVAKLFAYSSSTTDQNKELYNRLSNEKDHYYSYLYTALYIKEIEAQWKSKGFDVSLNPEIIATLFNIGFEHSKPNPTPTVGGTPITLGGKVYAYGELGGKFFSSQELPELP